MYLSFFAPGSQGNVEVLPSPIRRFFVMETFCFGQNLLQFSSLVFCWL